MKKIALFLIVAINILYVQVPIFSQADDYGLEADTLFQLNIADKEVFYDPNMQIKRADFALLAASLKGYDGQSVAGAPFIDIDKQYYAAGSIAYLKYEGVLNGYEDGTFRGEKTITYSEAIIILANMLGYKDIAGFEGEGQAGYIKTAQKIGLNKGIYAESSSELTQKDAFRLIYNALEIPIATIQLEGASFSYSYDANGETAMSFWLGLNKVRDLVKTVGTAAVTWDITGSRIMTVGNRQLQISEGNYYYGLGKYCDVYYYNRNTDREDEVAAVVVIDGKNNITEIDTDDIIDFKEGVLTYQKENSGTRNLRIDAKDDISINGVPVSATQREAALKNSDGKIIVNKIDNSEIGTIIMIDAYDTYFVTSIDNEELIIYGYYGKKLDLDEDDPLIIYNQLSDIVSFDDITKNDVLTIKTGADVCEIHICKEKEDGKISGINNEENTIKLGMTEHKLTADVANDVKSKMFTINDAVTAYFDSLGRIAYMETSSISNDGYSYAYLYELKENRRESDELYARLFTAKGELLKYSTAPKLKIDGEKISNTNDIYTKLYRGTGDITGTNGYSQIIRFSMNSDGKIARIDTVYKGSGETNNSLNILYQGYSNDKTEISKLAWRARGRNFDGKVLYEPSLVQFMTVPKVYTGDTEYFFIGKSMSEDDKIAFNAYSSNEDQLMPDILLSYINIASGTAAARVSETFFGIVTDIKTELNIDDEIETKISIDTNGGNRELILHENFNQNRIMPYSVSELDEKVAFTRYENGVSDSEAPYKLAKGDFAEITVDSLSRVIFARMIAKGDTGQNVMDSTDGGTYTNHFLYGYMHKNEGSRFSIGIGTAIPAAKADLRYCNTGDARIYRIKREGKRISVDKISIADVLDYKSANRNADKILAYTWAGMTQIVVVYEK